MPVLVLSRASSPHAHLMLPYERLGIMFIKMSVTQVAEIISPTICRKSPHRCTCVQATSLVAQEIHLLHLFAVYAAKRSQAQCMDSPLSVDDVSCVVWTTPFYEDTTLSVGSDCLI